MPGWNCAAPNCPKKTTRDARLFRFPTNPERRKRWVANCRWEGWKATDHSRLCEVRLLVVIYCTNIRVRKIILAEIDGTIKINDSLDRLRYLRYGKSKSKMNQMTIGFDESN